MTRYHAFVIVAALLIPFVLCAGGHLVQLLADTLGPWFWRAVGADV